VVAAVSAALLVIVSAHIGSLDALAYALLAAAGVAMGVCRRWPRLATGAVTVILAIFIVRNYPHSPVWVTGWAALGVLSWRAGRRVAITWSVIMLTVLSVLALVTGHVGVLVPVIFVGWAAAAILAGDAARGRRSRMAGLRERALYLERTREEEARRRVAEERLRIARDLHDSVAHAMTAINVQAGAAAHVLSRRPQEADGPATVALAAIQRASGEVLDELSAMLTVLRDGTEDADRAPLPGAGQLTRLAETARVSGLDVELSTDGAVGDIPAAVGTAVFRVVQESLTNVLRHSRATAARVRVVRGTDGSVLAEVADDGPAMMTSDDPAMPANDGLAIASAGAGTGVGIRGLRERVVSTGGRFSAGPAPDGGFLVRASWDARA
jgi:signal transduction histidine kinase